PSMSTSSIKLTASPLPTASLSKYKVQWERMSSGIRSAIERKEWLSAALRREFIRLVAFDIHEIFSHPGRQELRKICDRIVGEYPHTFQDVISGKLVGSGYDSLFQSLEWRIDNLNR